MRACLTGSNKDEESEDESNGSSYDGELVATESQVLAAAEVKRKFASPANWMLVFGAMLACCAGTVNVVAYLCLNRAFVSHVTGQTSKIGMALEAVAFGYMNITEELTDDEFSADAEKIKGVSTETIQPWDLRDAILLLLAFWFGAFLCGLIIPRGQIRFGGKAFYGVALLGNSALLVVATFQAEENLNVAAIWAAMACGLQNAMCTMHLGAIVRTTHVTGTVTDLGSTCGRAVAILLRFRCRCSRIKIVDRAELSVDGQKLKILCTLLMSFLAGSFIGGKLARIFGPKAFLFPAGVTFILGVAYTFFRDRLKRQMQKFAKEEVHEARDRLEDALRRIRTQNASLAKSDGDEDEDEELENMEEEMEQVMEIMRDMEEVVEARMEARARHGARSPTRRTAA